MNKSLNSNKYNEQDVKKVVRANQIPKKTLTTQIGKCTPLQKKYIFRLAANYLQGYEKQENIPDELKDYVKDLENGLKFNNILKHDPKTLKQMSDKIREIYADETVKVNKKLIKREMLNDILVKVKKYLGISDDEGCIGYVSRDELNKILQNQAIVPINFGMLYSVANEYAPLCFEIIDENISYSNPITGGSYKILFEFITKSPEGRLTRYMVGDKKVSSMEIDVFNPENENKTIYNINTTKFLK